VLSSKNESKHDARVAARLDVLMERVDTLASTVATTASAIAKKDGEIAGLRRDLEARDQTLQALVAQAREPRQAAADAPIDANELRALRNAVAALTKEHAGGAAATARVEQLAATVRSLAQQVDHLASRTSDTPAIPDPVVGQRVDALERELASTRSSVERLAAEPDRPSEELRAMLGTLRTQVEALSELRAGGVAEEQLDARFAESEDAIQALAQRLDTLAETVESAAAGLGEKEHELAALQRHFTESSARIESIVEDIRETLHAIPEPSSASIDDVAARLERIETAARKATEASARTAGELSGRIDAIDQRVATVAAEVSRAKTLWPVALRSLEARLDDAVHAHIPDQDDTTPDSPAADGPADDLLAGLRDSLSAMETVAAEMAKASETLAGSADAPPEEPDEQAAEDVSPNKEPHERLGSTAAAAAGATIVPLRASDP
jgi:chromosome segregation ATPase